jgi:hypothetical protein
VVWCSLVCAVWSGTVEGKVIKEVVWCKMVWRDRQTDRCTDRLTQTDRQIYSHTDRHTERQGGAHLWVHMCSPPPAALHVKRTVIATATDSEEREREREGEEGGRERERERERER